GSVTLSRGLPGDASGYAAEGSVAHGVAEDCLRSGRDAWEFIGEDRKSDDFTFTVSKDMADAVQVYLDAVRRSYPDGGFDIERGFYRPNLHTYFFGRSDLIYLNEAAATIDIWDYKHGAGIAVDPK